MSDDGSTDGDAYTLAYRPGDIYHGTGAVADLGEALATAGDDRALVVTSPTVGTTSAVIGPVRDGLGDRLVGTYDEVTPGKTLRTAVEIAERVREESADALVGLGGGSALDLAKVASALAGHDRPPEEVAREVVERESMLVPDGPLADVVAIPTTLPGADLSQVAGVNLTMDPDETPAGDAPSGGVSGERFMPVAVFHDAPLLATTPADVLARSAMNGYDKGLELLYTRHRTPITDATASRGLSLLQSSLPAIRDDPAEDDFSRILQGVALAQYGVSSTGAYRASIVHSFGHALSRRYPIQQGVAHAIAVPHVLRYLFDQVDGRRDLLAEALSVEGETREETAEAIVAAVAETRDALELPARLRTVEGVDRAHVPELAEAVLADSFMAAAPADLDATQEEIAAVFEVMW